MDEPFAKRPRLSIFASNEQLDDELGARRTRNDLLLKSRFESIFEKYSHDFSNVGDEIDMETLTVVVDNGHLTSMENETDPGRSRNTSGNTLLRAMTEAPDDGEDTVCGGGAHEVMESIEEMAENAAMAESEEDTAPMDSDEELFLPVHPRPSYITPPESAESRDIVNPDMLLSGYDLSLEARELCRTKSFEFSLAKYAPSSSQSCSGHPPRDLAQAHGNLDDTAILNEFGPEIGHQVLSILQKSRSAAFQAHIEPAWRLPPEALRADSKRVASNSRTPPSDMVMVSPPRFGRTPSPEQARSIWKPARHRSTKKEMQHARALERSRAESEDPLQEDFVAEDEEVREERHDRFESLMKREEANGAAAGPQAPQKSGNADERILQIRNGVCVYCKRVWKTSRNRAYIHWTQLAQRRHEIPEGDPHDLDFINAFLASPLGKPIGQRLYVADFISMVELHEGQGLSFDEIFELGTLDSKRPPTSLKNAYSCYRNVAASLKVDANLVAWSKQELEILHKLCLDPKLPMNEMAFCLPRRSNIEIGNKLAEICLMELESEPGQSVPAIVQHHQRFFVRSRTAIAKANRERRGRSPSIEALFSQADSGLTASSHRRRSPSVEALFIKTEHQFVTAKSRRHSQSPSREALSVKTTPGSPKAKTGRRARSPSVEALFVKKEPDSDDELFGRS
jgi:hypothetical protein